MSADQRLRRAERAAQLDNGHEAEVALLRARLRAGEISPARIELAAYMMNKAAAAVITWNMWKAVDLPFTDRAGVTEDGEVFPLDEMIRGLAHWGDAAVLCAVIGAVRAALPKWLACEACGGNGFEGGDPATEGGCPWCKGSGSGLPSDASRAERDVYAASTEAVEAAERCLLHPCDEHRAQCGAAYVKWEPPGDPDNALPFRCAWLGMRLGDAPLPIDEVMAAVSDAEAVAGRPLRADIQRYVQAWALGSGR